VHVARRSWGIVAVGLLLLPIVSPATAKYSGGTGEPNDPYQIATAADLIALGETPGDYDKHFLLTADIDLDPNFPGRKVFDKAVIAPDRDAAKQGFQGTSFTGFFDGNGCTISHVTVSAKDYVGLFGQLMSAAKVKDLGLVDVNVTGSGGNVGGLVGSNGGTLSRCYSTGAVSGKSYVGGLAGSGSATDSYSTATVSGGVCVGGLLGSGSATRSYSSGTVSGTGSVGGLVGDNRSTVTQCYSTGAVKGTEGRVGGLVGYNKGVVAQCHSTGAVCGGYYVGGLVGENNGYHDSAGMVGECYSTGAVTGAGGPVGGLLGSNQRGTVTHCYCTATVSGKSQVGGLVGENDGYDDDPGVVAECFSTGAVTGAGGSVGGLLGSNHRGTVTHCYCTGAVRSSHGYVGGLVGDNTWWGDDLSLHAGVVTGCFWDLQRSGQATSGGGTGKTTVEMQTAQTFLDAGWDFVGETKNGTEDLWWILDGAYYPLLWASAPSRAWSPYPEDGAADVGRGTILAWAPGRSATEYDVYFGEDADAVGGATVKDLGIYRGRQRSTRYDAAGLEWGKTYCWRIDEVNDLNPNSVWKGSVWSFTTADFMVVTVVDDFESYTDDWQKGRAIYQTWIDGLGPEPNVPGNGTGSVVGNPMPGCAEQSIVHGGKQSMPMDYSNMKKPWYSEAERTWATAQDWTIGSADTLTLYFRGEAGNRPDPLYVGIEDGAGRMATVVHPDANAVLATEWQKWHIPLAGARAAGVNLAAVNKLVIGVGDRQNPKPGGTGRIYIDDIRLTKRMP
jgi:hypothetical protein